jgi:hypothetical protein
VLLARSKANDTIEDGIIANAFVAQARRAVNVRQAAHSPNTNAAQTNRAAAQQDAAARRYLNVTAEAKAAVDLCAVLQS